MDLVVKLGALIRSPHDTCTIGEYTTPWNKGIPRLSQIWQSRRRNVDNDHDCCVYYRKGVRSFSEVVGQWSGQSQMSSELRIVWREEMFKGKRGKKTIPCRRWRGFGLHEMQIDRVIQCICNSFACQRWQHPFTPMNEIENYYNCIRNSQIERYLYRYEYLHLVSAVETVLILEKSHWIGRSGRFRNRMASDTFEHSAHCIWLAKGNLITTNRLPLREDSSLVRLLESGVSNRAPDPVRLQVLLSRLRDSSFPHHPYRGWAHAVILSSQCGFLQRWFSLCSISGLWSWIRYGKWVVELGSPIDIITKVSDRCQSERVSEASSGSPKRACGIGIHISCLFCHV